jgi:beta-galactosidase
VLNFAIAGPGALAAVDNGSNTSHEPYQTATCKPAKGQCIAIVKATAVGAGITLKATAPGLEAASVTIATSAKAKL